MDTPQMPHLPRPALVLNAALPMVAGGKIIPQSLWMESQMRSFAADHARQFEQAAAALSISLAELRHEATRALVAWDGTVLPKAHDGLMQERMECLRAALEGLGA